MRNTTLWRHCLQKIQEAVYTASKVDLLALIHKFMSKAKTYRTMIIYRRVDNGQIVTESFARRYPNLTIKEVRKVYN
jgi:hypothetical protein